MIHSRTVIHSLKSYKVMNNKFEGNLSIKFHVLEKNPTKVHITRDAVRHRISF